MKRQILSIIALFVALSGSAQSFTEGEFQYEALADGTLKVTACSLTESIVIIPSTVTHDGKVYTVTVIGSRVFADKHQLAAISLPSTITDIEASAFENCNATFIKMSPNVRNIGPSAFAGCKAMGHIDLPQSLQILSENAMSGTKLYTIGTDVLPNLTYVGDNALNGTSIPFFPLTDKVTYMGRGAFSGCRYLKGIYLPAGLTEIADYTFQNCVSLSDVTLPSGLQRVGNGAFMDSGITFANLPSGLQSIGDYAFNGSELTSINFSQFTGEIGVLAFNNCYHLPRITLPKNSPYTTSEDGKVIYDQGELLTVLPTVEKLVIPYPATGIQLRLDTFLMKEQRIYPLRSTFSDLTSLELPYTWNAPLNIIVAPSLKELTVRTPQPFEIGEYWGNESWYLENALTINVFDYAYPLFQENWHNRIYPEVQYQFINRPTEQLYMAEVIPMYGGMLNSIDEHTSVVWLADWETALVEQHPEYFTKEESFDGTYSSREYRSFMIDRYLTADKRGAYSWYCDSVVHCLDGNVRISSAFDANDYVNWYLSGDTVFCDTPYKINNSVGYMTTFTENGQNYWYFYPTSATGNPRFDFALPMLPGIPYNIYALTAPTNPNKITVDGEEVMVKNKLRFTLSYNNGAANGRPATIQSETIDVTYTGEIQSFLLFEDIEVERDYFNSIQLTTNTTSTDRRNGYANSVAFVGFLVVPQKDIDVLPSGVETVAGSENVTYKWFDLQGRQLSKPMRGVNIRQGSDGSVRRILVK